MAQSFNRVGNAPRVGIHLAGRRERGPLGTRLNSQFLRRAVWLQCVELVQGGRCGGVWDCTWTRPSLCWGLQVAGQPFTFRQSCDQSQRREGIVNGFGRSAGSASGGVGEPESVGGNIGMSCDMG